MQGKSEERRLEEPISNGLGARIKDYAQENPTGIKSKSMQRNTSLHIQLFRGPSELQIISSPILKDKRVSNISLTPKEKVMTLNRIQQMHLHSATDRGESDSIRTAGLQKSDSNTPIKAFPLHPRSENKFDFLKEAAQNSQSLSSVNKRQYSTNNSETFKGFLPTIRNIDRKSSNLSLSSADSTNTGSTVSFKEIGDTRIHNLLRKSQLNPSSNIMKLDIINENCENLMTIKKEGQSLEKNRIDSAKDWDQEYTPIYRRLGINLVQKFHPSVAEEQISQPNQDKESVRLGISFLKNSLISTPCGNQKSPRKISFRVNRPFDTKVFQLQQGSKRDSEFEVQKNFTTEITKFERNLLIKPYNHAFSKSDLDAFKRFQESSSKKI